MVQGLGEAYGGNVVSIGAEAVVLASEWLGLPAIVKIRIPKPYRDPRLDKMLRERRTVNEAKLLYEARRLGVPVPALYEVDLDKCAITMEYVEGTKLRDVLSSLPEATVTKLFFEIGAYSATMHMNGIVHGDLTTSNIILTPDGKVVIIDFGLGAFANDLESQGVDVHLLLRSLESAHYRLSQVAFDAFIKGYESVVKDRNRMRALLKKVKEIRMRGRYVEERRTKRE